MAQGDVEPIPRLPALESRIPSVRSPLLSVEKARSPFALAIPLNVACVSNPLIAAVVVAVVTVDDESELKSNCEPVEVALPRLKRVSDELPPLTLLPMVALPVW